MQRRTWSLIAIPAVLGAMAITVPALAGTSSSPKARTARARSCTAVIVISHDRDLLDTSVDQILHLDRGKLTLYKGKPGKNGTNGTNGTNGAAGAPGTARAYAVVQPTSPSAANLIVGQTSNITSVSEPTPGTYCVIPAAGINPSSYPPVVSQEISYSSAGPGVVAVNVQHPDCPTGFEVDTYAATSATPTTTATGYAFTIVIP